MWKWMLRFNAEPNRWMRVSAPVLAVSCVWPAFGPAQTPLGMGAGKACLPLAGPCCCQDVIYFDPWIISGALSLASCRDFVDRCA